MGFSFPARTDKDEIVTIVRKEYKANVGMFLYSDDDRVFIQKDGGQELSEVELVGDSEDAEAEMAAAAVEDENFEPEDDFEPEMPDADENGPTDPSA